MSEARAPDMVANPIARMLTIRQRPLYMLFFLQKTITQKFTKLPPESMKKPECCLPLKSSRHLQGGGIINKFQIRFLNLLLT